MPTDLAFNLAILMDENRGYFKIDTKLSQANKFSVIDIILNLEEHIFKDEKIKDSALLQQQ